MAVFCQALIVFPVLDWRRHFSWLWRHKFVAPDARVFMVPELVQVLFEGRMPVLTKENFALMPDFGQVFVKGRRPL